MNCPKCGADNIDEARFCTGCGCKLKLTNEICEACHTENPPGANFCVNCGKSVGVEAGRPAGVSSTINPPVEAKPISKSKAFGATKSDTKIAAVCVWIVSAFLVLIAFTFVRAMPACTGGGSGSTCPGPPFPSGVCWVLAILGFGYGGKLWIGKK
jgi:ribosomal protein L40E